MFTTHRLIHSLKIPICFFVFDPYISLLLYSCCNAHHTQETIKQQHDFFDPHFSLLCRPVNLKSERLKVFKLNYCSTAYSFDPGLGHTCCSSLRKLPHFRNSKLQSETYKVTNLTGRKRINKSSK